jgi:hypothetical protein
MSARICSASNVLELVLAYHGPSASGFSRLQLRKYLFHHRLGYEAVRLAG